MQGITLIENMPTKTSELLVEQFRKGAPKIVAMVQGVVAGWQEIENVLFDMGTLRGISAAVGAQLDRIGETVGLSRTSATDSVYRDDIRFQVYINRSNGEPETLIAALKRLTGADHVDYYAGTATAILTTNEPTKIPGNLLAKMRKIKAGGVGLEIGENTSDTPFIFDGEGAFGPYFSAGEGFGETGIEYEDFGGELTELDTTDFSRSY